jgi:hypothetical protein
MKTVLTILLLIAATGLAQDTLRNSPRSADSITGVIMDNYGDMNAACISWTDGCRICRQDAATEALCSNVAIACTPQEIVCTARRDLAR